MSLFGLIGFPLTHSFSKKYFTEKFKKEGLTNHSYELFEIPDVSELQGIIAQHQLSLRGLNVTIPHKQTVMPLLNGFDASAERVGAVNVIKILADGKLIGYNSDYYGFKLSLEKLLPVQPLKALVLGNGGAAKAVVAALQDLTIDYQLVSRQSSAQALAYADLNANIISTHKIIINCSPLGTYPKTEECPDIPYEGVKEGHILYDLVYNPPITRFMQEGLNRGATAVNGLEMLHLQAEKAWEIWNR